jgi:hypothetical protein
MDDGATGCFVGVLMIVFFIMGFVLGSEPDSVVQAVGYNRAMSELCPKILGYQTTLVDSLAIAEQWRECLWLSPDTIK